MFEHKGYQGAIDDTEPEGGWFHGTVIGIQDVVTFQGRSAAELAKAFQESVDDYLEFCADLKEAPEKPYSGRFVLRLAPQLHKLASEAARQGDVSLNSWIVAAVEQRLDLPATEPPALSRGEMETLAERVAALLGKKRRGATPAPRRGKRPASQRPRAKIASAKA